MISSLKNAASSALPFEASRVFVVRSEELDVYLAKHTDLATIIEQICKALREKFGDSTELALELYKDPEDPHRYPVIYVRREHYEQGIFDHIETVTDRFRDQIEATGGDLLVTTDFRHPSARS
jgi:hypothetical protein